MLISRVTAVAFALALAFAGAVGSSGHDTDSPNTDATEQAGGTWS